MITTEHSPISAEELELLWVDYPKFGEYDQLIRLDRIPKGALGRILEYTNKEFPAFRQYLQRDIERYQEPKQWIRVEMSVFNEALAKFDPYKGGAFRSTKERDKGGWRVAC